MNRWTPAFLFLPLAVVAAPAFAQGFVREAPKDVKPAVMAVSATPPVISINGRPDRLSPGARIRDTNNLLVLSGALANKSVYTVYRRDSAGLVHEVWLLTPQEYEKVANIRVDDAQGYKRFNELLALIWSARGLLLGQ